MMLAKAQLIWFYPDELNVDMCEEPYNSSVVRVVLTTIVDFQYMEFTDSLQQQENINLLDKKPETTDFKNGFAKIGVGDEEFAKPVGKMFVENNDGEIASQVLTVEVFAEGNDAVEDDGEEEFTTRALVRKLLKNFNIRKSS